MINKKNIVYLGIFNISLLWGWLFYLFSTLESLKTVWWLILYGSISVFDVIVPTNFTFSFGLTLIILLFALNVFLIFKQKKKTTSLNIVLLAISLIGGIGMAWIPFSSYFFLHIALLILMIIPLTILLSKQIGWSILVLQSILLATTFFLGLFITGAELFMVVVFTYWHIKYQILPYSKSA